MVIPISSGIACGLAISNKAVYETVVQKDIKYKKQSGKDQQTINCFDKLQRKHLQGNLLVENEEKSLCNFLTKSLDATKIEFVL